MPNDLPVVVVGAGLAGLACARELARAGTPVVVAEASDAPGGRVRTDAVDGYLLDRGFQVFLTAYPEARVELDYPALDLKPFYPGALVRYHGRFHRVSDPRRHPAHAALSLASPIGDLSDKLRVLRLVARGRGTRVEGLFRRPETTTREALRDVGFSETMIVQFFEPFLGGIFLDRTLGTSSRMLDFVIRMMSTGDIALPATGMGAISRQLAAGLSPAAVRYRTIVTEVRGDGVRIDAGEWVAASSVVVATDGRSAAQLTRSTTAPRFRSTVCLYWTAEASPVHGPYLVLDGDRSGPVNNLCVPSEVARGYAPSGQALISATVLGARAADGSALEVEARAQLRGWFGGQVDRWKYLRGYSIPLALPDQDPPTLAPEQRPLRLGGGVYLAGDFVADPSINGALLSGRRAARAVLDDRR